jgi:hypothetical protein
MTTEDLIDRLGHELRPMKPLASPGRRASLWLACAIAYVAVVVIQAWIRHGAIGATADLPYVLVQTTVASLGVAAALVAFASVVPGRSASRARGVAVVAATVMIAALGWGVVRDLNTVGTLGLGRETDWPCVISISLGGGALWALAVTMLRRGAPLTPISTSVMSAVAALGLANLEACLSRPHAFTATVLVWHGATAIVLLGAFVGVGRPVFRWQRTPAAECA